jgi:hypothetical protein
LTFLTGGTGTAVKLDADGAANQQTFRAMRELTPDAAATLDSLIDWNLAPSAPEVLSFSLSRGPCFGTCPVYTVIFQADGRAQWRGEWFVDRMGDYSGEASQADSRLWLALRSGRASLLSKMITLLPQPTSRSTRSKPPQARVTRLYAHGGQESLQPSSRSGVGSTRWRNRSPGNRSPQTRNPGRDKAAQLPAHAERRLDVRAPRDDPNLLERTDSERA